MGTDDLLRKWLRRVGNLAAWETVIDSIPEPVTARVLSGLAYDSRTNAPRTQWRLAVHSRGPDLWVDSFADCGVELLDGDHPLAVIPPQVSSFVIRGAAVGDVMKRLRGETRWGLPPSRSGSSTSPSPSRSPSPFPSTPFPHMNPFTSPPPNSSPSGPAKAPRKRSLAIETATGPVIGYRRWNLAQDGIAWRLESVGIGRAAGFWPVGKVTAECHARGHYEPAPVADCSCGIYVFREPTGDAGGEVIGAVQAWGRCIEYREGWRAQFVRILALSWAARPGDTLDADRVARLENAAQAYGVPLFERVEGMVLMAHELAG